MEVISSDDDDDTLLEFAAARDVVSRLSSGSFAAPHLPGRNMDVALGLVPQAVYDAAAHSRCVPPCAFAYTGEKRLSALKDGHLWSKASDGRRTVAGDTPKMMFRFDGASNDCDVVDMREWRLVTANLSTCMGCWQCPATEGLCAEGDGNTNGVRRGAHGEVLCHTCSACMVHHASCHAERWRFKYASQSDWLTVYVHVVAHVSDCMDHRKMLRPRSYREDLAPGMQGLVSAAQQNMMCAFTSKDPTRAATSMQRVRELHADSSVMSQDELRPRKSDKVTSMSVQELAEKQVRVAGTTIVAYHNDTTFAHAPLCTILVEGLLSVEADRQIMYDPEWEYSAVNHVLAMCDDGAVRALLNPALVERMQTLWVHYDEEHTDVVRSFYSCNYYTYDVRDRKMVTLYKALTQRCDTATLGDSRQALTTALRRHLTLAHGGDWSEFVFRFNQGLCLDEGFAGIKAHCDEGVVGCQQHVRLDLTRTKNHVCGSSRAMFVAHTTSMLFQSATTDEFIVCYSRAMTWFDQQVGSNRKVVAEFWNFWMEPARLLRVATAFRRIGAPKTQMCEVMHACTQLHGRNNVSIGEAVVYELELQARQRKARHGHFTAQLRNPRASGQGVAGAAAVAAASMRQRTAVNVLLPSHRHDKAVSVRMTDGGGVGRKQRVYSTKPKGDQVGMKAVVSSEQDDRGEVTYEIELNGNNRIRVESQCVAAGDRLMWEQATYAATGSAHTYESPISHISDIQLKDRQRTDPITGAVLDCRFKPSASRQQLVTIKKATNHAGQGLIKVKDINWLTPTSARLRLLFQNKTEDSTHDRLSEHEVVVSRELTCCCLFYASWCSAESSAKGGNSNCSHVVRVLHELLHISFDDPMIWQVAWTSQELDSVLPALKLVVREDVREYEEAFARAQDKDRATGHKRCAADYAASGNPYGGTHTSAMAMRLDSRKKNKSGGGARVPDDVVADVFTLRRAWIVGCKCQGAGCDMIFNRGDWRVHVMVENKIKMGGDWVYHPHNVSVCPRKACLSRLHLGLKLSLSRAGMSLPLQGPMDVVLQEEERSPTVSEMKSWSQSFGNTRKWPWYRSATFQFELPQFTM